ncbi:MAG: hypothetical protein MUD10_03830 [Candidatus Pacebacteria bacterium]|nr:hypothetical protein [Candidatus Paceibacterota bacterium]
MAEEHGCFPRRVANGTIVELKEMEPLDIVFGNENVLPGVKVIDFETPEFLARIGRARLVNFEAGGGILHEDGTMFRGSAQVVTDANGRVLRPFYQPKNRRPGQTHAHFFAAEGQPPMVLVRSDWSRHYHKLEFKLVTIGRSKEFVRVSIKQLYECDWQLDLSDGYVIELPDDYSCYEKAAIAAIEKSMCPGCTGTHFPHQPHSRAAA